MFYKGVCVPVFAGKLIAGFLSAGGLLFFSAFCVLAAQEDLSTLQAALMNRDFVRVGEIVRVLLKERPSAEQEATLRYYSGLSALRLGRYAEAENVFRRLEASRLQEELSDQVTAGLIDALYLQGFYEKALQESGRALARRRGSAMSSAFYLKAARANLKLAHWVKAGELLRRLAEEYPLSFESDVARQLLEEQQYFTVQVGSFTDKALAQRLVDELTRRQEYAFIVESRASDGRTNFRVRVGRLSNLRDAVTLEAKLAGLGYPTLIYP